MHITILDGRCPYFSDRFLFIWQVLHDFIMDRMVKYARGAEDNCDTVSLRAIAMALVL